MAVLYTHTTAGTSFGMNDGANWWYALEFVCATTGTPTDIDIYIDSIVGSPVNGEVYIRDQKSASSSNYGSATGITWSGTGAFNVVLSGGAQITSGNTYYVCIKSPSATNYARLQLDSSLDANFQEWRGAASNGDPTTGQNKNYTVFVLNGSTGGTTTHNLASIGAGN